MAIETLNITEDAYTHSANPNSAYPSAGAIAFGQASSSTYYGFFHIPAPSITATSAVLKFVSYAISTRPAGDVQVYSLDAPWTENTITYNTMPGMTLAKTVAVPAQAQNGTFEIDLTGVDTTNGIALGRTDGQYSQPYSSEETNVDYRPYIEYDNTNVTLDITEDTITNGAAATTNYGTYNLLFMHSGVPYQTWVKVPEPTLASGESVIDAVLALVSNSATGNPFTVEIYTADAPWEESTITHANKPATTLAKSINIEDVPPGRALYLDITGVDTTNGLMLNRTDAVSKSFHSSEAATVAFRPVMKYTVEAESVIPQWRGWGLPL